MICRRVVGAAMATMMLAVAMPASAQHFAGELVVSTWGACPDGTVAANGAVVPVQKEAPAKGEDYRELFKLYGTAFGGDGITGFGLPDMRVQQLAFNDLTRKPSALPGDKSAPAMAAQLPMTFCIVLHAGKSPG